MASALVEATSRAFGMLVFITLYLWMSRQGFPKNWLLLALIFVALVPIALLYGWLTDARAGEGAASGPRVPKLLLIGIGAALVICGTMLFAAQVDAMFYPVDGVPE